MAVGTITTARLDYLQRVGVEPGWLADGGPRTTAPAELRRMLHIAGIGRPRKEPTSIGDEQRPRVPTEDAITGLYGYRIPIVFSLWGSGGGVSIELGTWSPLERESASAATLDARASIVESVLRTLYPFVDISPAAVQGLPSALAGGFALGVPTLKRADPADGSVAIDRLIRGLSGGTWGVVVLAEPVEEAVNQELRHQVLNDIRAVEAEAQAEGAPSALAKHYNELLGATLGDLAQGLAAGAWRTAVYLLGDRTTYYRLASAWRAIFSGERSLPDPVRVFDDDQAVALARDFVLPDAAGPIGPGAYRHPFAAQTLLTSAQLAAYVRFPELETAGFQIRALVPFDLVPAPVRYDASVPLGRVVHGTRPTRTEYAIERGDLKRHVFVTGVTGSGKTNTVFYLLEQAGREVPFLVIEPAKREYRALARHPELGERLRVYTVGDERIAPLRINPFEVPAGVTVASHLDLLRSVFAASFGFWTPLPQVLERCLHKIYADRGWDLASDTNSRVTGPENRSAAFPTLTDLARAVEDVVPTLGYEERITSDLRAALLTRIESLRTGGKGRLLDVQRSTPIAKLLEDPVVLELEPMGDDDDKTFLMGLLLVRLAEERRTAGERKELQHVVVIEEAHRLLSRTSGPKSEEEGDIRGKAVETFANLLAEVRAYGQGVVVVDQVPVRLDPSVIKNTNLKVAHRIVAADDREVLAGSMAMDDAQARGLAVLPVGHAAVFRDGEDAPLVVEVPLAKGTEGVEDSVLRERARIHEDADFDGVSPGCGPACARSQEACRAARLVVEGRAFDRVFSRVAQSTIEDPDALDRLWPDVLAVVRPARPAYVEEHALLECVATHAPYRLAARRGGQAGWSYADTAAFTAAFAEAMLAKVAGKEGTATAFHRLAQRLAARNDVPFPMCDRVCAQQPPVCLYRHAAADRLADPPLVAAWREAVVADDPAGQSRARWEAAMDAGAELIEFPEPGWPDELFDRVAEAARRASLCWAQQQLAADPARSPRALRAAMDDLLLESGHEQPLVDREVSDAP
ncbi:MAG: DUF87 domain-containing protein [Actinomycetota bacterium]|nr:DUF87 domain-containing protein [Actinomycetota bacterium]